MDIFDDVWNNMAKVAKKNEHLGSLHMATDPYLSSVVPFGIPTGIPELDLALGRPGYPVGRIIEAFGFEGSGKTTLALHAVAQMQKMGGAVLWQDAEHCFDVSRAKGVGVNVEDPRFKIVSPDTIEDIWRWLELLVESVEGTKATKPVLCVVDSITGVSSEENDGKDAADADRIGTDARIIRKMARRLNPRLAKAKITTLFINHAIAKTTGYGKQSMAAGGHAIKFFASTRIELAALGQLKEGEERIGQKVQINAEKVKTAPLRFPKFDIALLNEGGYDFNGSLLQAMTNVGMVKHTKGSKIYTLVDGGENFQSSDFDDIVDKNGGKTEMYHKFYIGAIAGGYIFPYLSAGPEEKANAE